MDNMMMNFLGLGFSHNFYFIYIEKCTNKDSNFEPFIRYTYRTYFDFMIMFSNGASEEPLNRGVQLRFLPASWKSM